MVELTHFNEVGEAHMVDVGAKAVTSRHAIAEGWIRMQPETLTLIRTGGHAKGDVLGIARIAGIMAAKRTSELIPLCHPLALSHIRIDLEPDPPRLRVHCRARVATQGQTGVEMEALCAVQVSLLTIYDMCKAVDRGMCIEAVRLVEKAGGKSGPWSRQDDLEAKVSPGQWQSSDTPDQTDPWVATTPPRQPEPAGEAAIGADNPDKLALAERERWWGERLDHLVGSGQA